MRTNHGSLSVARICTLVPAADARVEGGQRDRPDRLRHTLGGRAKTRQEDDEAPDGEQKQDPESIDDQDRLLR